MPTSEKVNTSIRDKYPNAWIALEDGDKLQGVVARVARAWSDARARNGSGFYPLLEVTTDDGATLGFHAFSAVSYNRVIESRPLPGERIIITYRGLGKDKPGQNAPKLFNIVMPDRDPRVEATATYDMFGDARQNAQSTGQPPQVDSDVDQGDIPF